MVEDSKMVLEKYIKEPLLPKLQDPKLSYFPYTLQANSLQNLFHIPPSAINTQIVAKRDQQTGKIQEFIEIEIENAGSDSKNSFAMQRAPNNQNQATRGTASNFPFWPGGFVEKPIDDIKDLIVDIDDFNDVQNLLTVAPSFSNGLDFSHLKRIQEKAADNLTSIDILSVIENRDEDIFGISKKEIEVTKDEVKRHNLSVANIEFEDKLLEIGSKSSDVLKIRETKVQQQTAEWAEMIDISQPVKNFYDRVADMAHQFPFELDTFQKQAILKLENHNHVFVAAHTSAGKTVVAEYCIALSKKHMTKSIYTSPIKALSNQKYRDFKQTFGDVGLITG